MSDGHYRQECEHGSVIRQCRCGGFGTEAKRLEVIRPCPFGIEHLGLTVVHPLPPAEAVGDGLGQVPQDQAESLAGGLGGSGGATGTPEPPDEAQNDAQGFMAQINGKHAKDPDGLAKLLEFHYARPHAEHWEQLTERQRAYWRADAQMVRAYLATEERR